jgi:hypothetical protein
VAQLTPAQRRARDLLRECDAYADGWGIMVSPGPTTAEDGQAWIYFRTALAMERRGIVELDVRFGRVRLLDRAGA